MNNYKPVFTAVFVLRDDVLCLLIGTASGAFLSFPAS